MQAKRKSQAENQIKQETRNDEYEIQREMKKVNEEKREVYFKKIDEVYENIDTNC